MLQVATVLAKMAGSYLTRYSDDVNSSEGEDALIKDQICLICPIDKKPSKQLDFIDLYSKQPEIEEEKEKME
jgi:hypothetical protein